MMNSISVLVVDDHPMIRSGVRASLAQRREISIVGEAADGLEAVEKAQLMKPDVILMDLSMPHLDGLEATKRLAKAAPGSRILILTMHDDPRYVRAAVRNGAKGYILKDSSPEDLFRAIIAVCSGTTFFSARASQLLLNEVVEGRGTLRVKNEAELTPREREVLILVAKGLANKEIARQLGIGTRTIETHRERIGSKLGLRGAAALTRYAIKHGMASLE